MNASPAGSHSHRWPKLLLAAFANLIPLYQVLVGGWTLSELIALFWLENLIVGIAHFCKLLLCNPAKRPRSAGDRLAIEFFVVFYGGFAVFQGLALVLGYFFIEFDGRTLAQTEPFSSGAGLSWFWWALAVITALHLTSFVREFLLGGGRQRETIDRLGLGPLARVVSLQFFLVGGGVLAGWFGQPLWALMVLVMVKTTADLAATWLPPRQRPRH